MTISHHALRTLLAALAAAICFAFVPADIHAEDAPAPGAKANTEEAAPSVHLPETRQHTPLVGGRKGLIITSAVFFIASAFMIALVFRTEKSGRESSH